MIFQVRDIAGRKCLERDDPAEVKYWLHGKPAHHFYIWILSDYPGDLKAIHSAREFIQG